LGREREYELKNRPKRIKINAVQQIELTQKQQVNKRYLIEKQRLSNGERFNGRYLFFLGVKSKLQVGMKFTV